MREVHSAPDNTTETTCQTTHNTDMRQHTHTPTATVLIKTIDYHYEPYHENIHSSESNELTSARTLSPQRLKETRLTRRRSCVIGLWLIMASGGSGMGWVHGHGCGSLYTCNGSGLRSVAMRTNNYTSHTSGVCLIEPRVRAFGFARKKALAR